RRSLVRHSLTYPSTATAAPATEPYTLSLHDALPISSTAESLPSTMAATNSCTKWGCDPPCPAPCRKDTWLGSSIFSLLVKCLIRSEEHTSELQSRENLVCRLLLEKKKEEQTTS